MKKIIYFSLALFNLNILAITPPKKTKSVIEFKELIINNKINAVEVFKKEINNPGLIVVKFSAKWCGPCNAYTPTFDAVAKANPEVKIDDKTSIAVKYYAIDIDEYQTVAFFCKIRPIPAVFFYKNGKLLEVLIGKQNEKVLTDKIKQLAKS